MVRGVDAIHFDVEVFDRADKERLTTGRLAVFPVGKPFARLRWNNQLTEDIYTLRFADGKQWRVGMRTKQGSEQFAVIFDSKVPDFLLS